MTDDQDGRRPRRGPGYGRRRGGSTDSEMPLAQALDGYLRAQGHGETWLFGAICGCWDDVVGADVATHARPRSLTAGTLVVAVDHAGWATQLAFLGDRILAELTDRLGRPAAERLKVTVRSRSDVE